MGRKTPVLDGALCFVAGMSLVVTLEAASKGEAWTALLFAGLAVFDVYLASR